MNTTSSSRLRTITGLAVVGHPVTRAWLAVHPQGVPPDKIEVIKEQGQSAAYRLSNGAGSDTVIAKRSPADDHATELGFYMRVLPALAIETPHCHGSITDEDGCWLFLDDVGDACYQPERPSHRRLAGKWLAALHSAPEELRQDVPERGLAYHLEALRSTHAALESTVGHPAVGLGGERTLSLILQDLEAIDTVWPELEAASLPLNDGLVHGDFVPKNVRVMRRSGSETLVAFDWGTSGWGPPGTDLSEFDGRDMRDGLAAYLSRIGGTHPGIALADVVRAGAAGFVLRLIRAICWEAENLRYGRTEHALESLPVYDRYWRRALGERKWAVL